MSIQTKVFDAMQTAGLKTYLPGQHEGKCTATYYVVSDAGRRLISRNNAERVVLVTVYVPAETPLLLDDALISVREALIRLRNVKAGDSSEPTLDVETEAVFVSVELTALCSVY